jgi:hypothetical protein
MPDERSREVLFHLPRKPKMTRRFPPPWTVEE